MSSEETTQAPASAEPVQDIKIEDIHNIIRELNDSAKAAQEKATLLGKRIRPYTEIPLDNNIQIMRVNIEDMHKDFISMSNVPQLPADWFEFAAKNMPITSNADAK